ncbi:glycoside hydrolase family 3 C-terminal domain-containing protein, partial [candidate division KSB1 bacterium]
MGVAFVQSFEKSGVIATPKHFVANTGDGGRDSYPVHFSERLLNEVYFPAFRACIEEAGAQSVMTAYNSLDGAPCTASDYLLNRILKDVWGFKGFVISDASAVGGILDLHHTVSNREESAEQAIENGLDVIFQTDYNHHIPLFRAFETGMIDKDIINNAVARVLSAKFRLGLFENPYVDPDEAKKWNGHEKHRNTALEAARKSIVLLKNDSNVLPLKKSIKSVAVIGSDAVEARLGGYSGPGINKINILTGIKSKLSASSAVDFVEGCGRYYSEFETVPGKFLMTQENGVKKQGLKGEYFNNIDLIDKPVLTRIDPQVNFKWTLFSPHPDVNIDWYSVRWTGYLTSSETGVFNLGLEGSDGFRLYINEKLLIDNWKKETYRTLTVPVDFKAGKEYEIKIEFFENVGNSHVRLVWDAGLLNDKEKKIKEAVAVAEKSDVAVIVAGLEEGEFRDRAKLNLPGQQDKLIKEVASTGIPVIVVLIGGSAVNMTAWIDKVYAVVEAWYPGEAGGSAVADVIFGDYNPAGRLPITFPVSEAQLPLYYNHKPTGRGDDYLNMTGYPLFPFGHGLSYTTFKYSDLRITPGEVKVDGKAKASFTVTNSGNVQGEEVVQLYIKDQTASFSRPVMELKGFERISLLPGEIKEITMEITPEILSMLDKNLNWVVEPGDFSIMIGSSSRDIRLRGILKVSGK